MPNLLKLSFSLHHSINWTFGLNNTIQLKGTTLYLLLSFSQNFFFFFFCQQLVYYNKIHKSPATNCGVRVNSIFQCTFYHVMD